ncbi:SGNH/GDSL hydrolase family protein [Fictibacillus terranigra]|uniref:SGNH/GDSL hydrolase family protein n=1 Tax=Fictibacillus terranigra TaxID=3058424 RepID=A0ABT8EDI3_9BACL|nr:SGNH/GDSL hydrolase family protein [Fictibacillus sp. CENA-BCM004]MDN4075988.1 SGNH/GDSL hydrolase family protein [Fictibacillus sp. CENA-BCM004]
MKQKKVIACLGDSMTAFWGPEMPQLREALSSAFTDQDFELHNYGVGNTRAEYGNYRITHEYPNPFGEGKQKSLSAVSPDLVVVESFAYNHRLDGQHHISNYQNILKQIVQTIKETTPAKVLFLVTIPPDKNNFLNNVLPLKDIAVAIRREWAEYTDQYLHAAIDFAEKEELPFANVYQRVLNEIDRGTPIRWFIDQNDNIHPSRYAYLVKAGEIVNAIKKHKLLF